MAENDNTDYELLPHEELERLRKEVEDLKKNPLGNVKQSHDLMEAMGKMTQALHYLIDILSRTNDEMVSEFRRTTVSQHFEKISSQNEKIAKAVLSLAQLQDDSTAAQTTQAPVQTFGQTQDNVPGMMNTNASLPTQADAQAPAEQTPLPQGEPEAPQVAQAAPSAPAPTTPNSEGSLPPLDLPPPEHKKKGVLGMFQ